THAERRADHAALDERGAGIPGLAPRDVVESGERHESAVGFKAQDARIVRSDEDGVAERRTAGGPARARPDSCPFTPRRGPAERLASDDREDTAGSVGCETGGLPLRNLALDGAGAYGKEAPAPGCDEQGGRRGHDAQTDPDRGSRQFASGSDLPRRA